MNGKKAKLLRKNTDGGVDKKVKRMYNQLSHHDKNVLTQVFDFAKSIKKEEDDERIRTE
jgi:hemerythrin superfamily protein